MPGSGSHPLSRTRGDLLRPGHATSKPWTWPARSGSARAAAEPLAGLGRCARDAVRTADAEAGLRQALAIFQRMRSGPGSPVTFCDGHRTVFATASGQIQLIADILAAVQVVRPRCGRSN